eukprot:3571787-Rhodomonas_salina.2
MHVVSSTLCAESAPATGSSLALALDDTYAQRADVTAMLLWQPRSVVLALGSPDLLAASRPALAHNIRRPPNHYA